MSIFQTIKIRRGTSPQWSAANPILALAEVGIELHSASDHKIKIGDGVTVWNDLAYWNNGLPKAEGNLKLIQIDNAVAIGSNLVTGERGFLTKCVNRTGETSVKGTLVSCSTAADNEIIKQANEYDVIGVIAESGIPEGSEVWMWKNGSRCQVLYKDGEAATRGNILLAADTDGRAIDITNPGSGLPAVDTHFKECGHVCESKSSGTNILVLADLHFN